MISKPVLSFAAATLSFAFSATAVAGNTVTVTLRDGERLTAEVDQRTSSEQLCLRFAYGRAVVTRDIAWELIVSGSIDKEKLDAAAFRARAMQLRTPYEPPREPRSTSPKSRPLPPVPQPSLPELPFVPAEFGRVASIHVDARLAQWDADADFDGLLVRCTPLDAWGNALPVSGTLDVTLLGARSRQSHHLGRWVCAVEAIEGGGAWLAAGGFAHRLPFQTVDPGVDFSIGRLGCLHVSFAVPGHGVFEATLPSMELRPLGNPWHRPRPYRR